MGWGGGVSTTRHVGDEQKTPSVVDIRIGISTSITEVAVCPFATKKLADPGRSLNLPAALPSTVKTHFLNERYTDNETNAFVAPASIIAKDGLYRNPSAAATLVF